MGGQADADVNVSKAENTVSGLKTDSEDLLESYVSLVCVIEQHYVSIFFTRLWS